MRSLILVIIFATGLFPVFSQSDHDRKEILAILKRQETDWNRGDIASFMIGYWESDSLSFTGAKGITYGYKPVYDNYLKRYPDKTAMGKLRFEVKRLYFLSPENAQMIGKYHLTRPDIGDAEGYFTLIWRKINGKWVITSDHTSG